METYPKYVESHIYEKEMNKLSSVVLTALDDAWGHTAKDDWWTEFLALPEERRIELIGEARKRISCLLDTYSDQILNGKAI